MSLEIGKREVETPEKPEKALSDGERQAVAGRVRDWMGEFARKEKRLDEEDPKLKEKKSWEAEVADMDENTAPEPREISRTEEEDSALTREELEQLAETDPGYVNDRVLDYDNELEQPGNHYRTDGSHTGAVRWGEYALDDSREYVVMKPGTVLGRWGGEEGRFLADPGTAYEDLQLPVVQEKQSHSLYEVLKEFPAEASLVARQPWNEEGGKPALQYVTPVSIRELVEGGYLKKKET